MPECFKVPMTATLNRPDDYPYFEDLYFVASRAGDGSIAALKLCYANQAPCGGISGPTHTPLEDKNGFWFLPSRSAAAFAKNLETLGLIEKIKGVKPLSYAFMLLFPYRLTAKGLAYTVSI